MVEKRVVKREWEKELSQNIEREKKFGLKSHLKYEMNLFIFIL